jgi:hypothetical protein
MERMNTDTKWQEVVRKLREGESLGTGDLEQVRKRILGYEDGNSSASGVPRVTKAARRGIPCELPPNRLPNRKWLFAETTSEEESVEGDEESVEFVYDPRIRDLVPKNMPERERKTKEMEERELDREYYGRPLQPYKNDTSDDDEDYVDENEADEDANDVDDDAEDGDRSDTNEVTRDNDVNEGSRSKKYVEIIEIED